MVNFFKYILPKFYNKINLALRYLGRSTKGGEQKLNLEVRDESMHFPHRVRKLTRNTFSSFYSSACLAGDPSTGDASSERAHGSGSPSADISALGGRPPGPLTSQLHLRPCSPSFIPRVHWSSSTCGHSGESWRVTLPPPMVSLYSSWGKKMRQPTT